MQERAEGLNVYDDDHHYHKQPIIISFFLLFYSRYTDGSTILQKTHHRSLYVSSYKHYGLPWRKVVAGDHHDLHDGGLYDGDLHDGEL